MEGDPLTLCPLPGCTFPARGERTVTENGVPVKDTDPLCDIHARLIAARTQVTLCSSASSLMVSTRRHADLLWLEARAAGVPLPDRYVAPMSESPHRAGVRR